MGRLLILLNLALVPASLASEWKEVSEGGGVRVETREVKGSGFEEIRVTGEFAATPARACEAIWARDLNPPQDWFPKREVVRETLNERWYYEVVATPLVQDRDYTVHLSRESDGPLGCLLRFDLDNAAGPPKKKGVVRMAALRGSWQVTPSGEAGARVVYTLFNDPGGNVPAFLSRGSQRTRAVEWVKGMMARALAAPVQPAVTR
ncbi:MAG: SRPBCC family protein [Myxococcaceae bacterium]